MICGSFGVRPVELGFRVVQAGALLAQQVDRRFFVGNQDGQAHKFIVHILNLAVERVQGGFCLGIDFRLSR